VTGGSARYRLSQMSRRRQRLPLGGAPMAQDRQTLLGIVIAVGLALYAALSDRWLHWQTPIRRAGDGGHGRFAEEPGQITAAGWYDILARVFTDIGRDNISLMAAGIAFYALLALAPALTALVALYGLVFDPSQVEAQVKAVEGLIPSEGRQLIAQELSNVVQARSSTLGIGFILSLAVSIGSANSATSAMMSALNVIYAESEKRGILRYYATTLVLTASGVVFALLSLLLIAVIPAVLGLLPLGNFDKELVSAARWPVLLLLFGSALAVIYRHAPSRNQPRWSWVSWGAAAATLLLIVGSALFSVYVGRFAAYNKTYGSLGAVVVLLMWFWMSAYAVLLGAELNAEMEHQTARDTTDRPKKPMGTRGAYVADTIAEQR
jgi:membrane protein